MSDPVLVPILSGFRAIYVPDSEFNRRDIITQQYYIENGKIQSVPIDIRRSIVLRDEAIDYEIGRAKNRITNSEFHIKNYKKDMPEIEDSIKVLEIKAPKEILHLSGNLVGIYDEKTNTITQSLKRTNRYTIALEQKVPVRVRKVTAVDLSTIRSQKDTQYAKKYLRDKLETLDKYIEDETNNIKNYQTLIKQLTDIKNGCDPRKEEMLRLYKHEK
jgi:hypothetical protein